MPHDAIVLFTCPRHAGELRLTPDACAQMWKRGAKADPCTSAAVCRGCKIGAVHAGQPGEEAATAALAEKVCVRCGSVGRRMIHVRGVCVSCYNREREIEIGRDRRGAMPRRPAQVPVLDIAIGQQLVARAAAGRVELALWAMRSSPGAVIARWIPHIDVTATVGGDPL